MGFDGVLGFRYCRMNHSKTFTGDNQKVSRGYRADNTNKGFS